MLDVIYILASLVILSVDAALDALVSKTNQLQHTRDTDPAPNLE